MRVRGLFAGILLLTLLTLLWFPRSAVPLHVSPKPVTVTSFASAANPCGEATPAAWEETQSYLTLAVEYFQSRPLSVVFPADKQDQGPVARTLYPAAAEHPVTMTYTAIPPKTLTDLPVILVNFSTASYAQSANGILWLKKGKWLAQPYPQAEPDVAMQRREVLRGGFCRGVLLDARQEGNLLAVINDLGAWGTRSAQEVHLLKLDERGWQMLSVPVYEDWRTLWMSMVTFGEDGIRTYSVVRRDIEKEEYMWKEIFTLQGDQYIQTASEPYPGPK